MQSFYTPTIVLPVRQIKKDLLKTIFITLGILLLLAGVKYYLR